MNHVGQNFVHCSSSRRLSARMWYLQCVSTGDTTVLHKIIQKICLSTMYFPILAWYQSVYFSRLFPVPRWPLYKNSFNPSSATPRPRSICALCLMPSGIGAQSRRWTRTDWVPCQRMPWRCCLRCWRRGMAPNWCPGRWAIWLWLRQDSGERPTKIRNGIVIMLTKILSLNINTETLYRIYTSVSWLITGYAIGMASNGRQIMTWTYGDLLSSEIRLSWFSFFELTFRLGDCDQSIGHMRLGTSPFPSGCLLQPHRTCRRPVIGQHSAWRSLGGGRYRWGRPPAALWGGVEIDGWAEGLSRGPWSWGGEVPSLEVRTRGASGAGTLRGRGGGRVSVWRRQPW